MIGLYELNDQMTTAAKLKGFTDVYTCYMDETNFLTRFATYPVMVIIPPILQGSINAIRKPYTTTVTLYGIASTSYERDDFTLVDRLKDWDNLANQMILTFDSFNDNANNFHLSTPDNFNFEYLNLGVVVDNTISVRATVDLIVNCAS